MSTDRACRACGSTSVRESSAGRGSIEDHEYRYWRCRDCHTAFVWPPPPPQVIGRMYGPEYASAHYADGGREEVEIEATLDLLCRRIPKGRLLDVGAGSGFFLTAARRRGLQADGQELTEAAARALRDSCGGTIHAGPLSAIASRYDAVHLADVLEHVVDPAALLIEARGLLAPGGIICARGPLEGQPNLFDVVMRARRAALSLLKGPSVSTVPPWHLTLFSLRGWRALAARAGLREQEGQVSEVWWPVSPQERGLKHAVKRASLAFSASGAGRKVSAANRVVSVFAPG